MFSQLALTAIFLVSTVQEITPIAIEQAVESNRHKVREFSIIADLAKELNVRVWIFGGSAASFAHYVKWDLERQKGDNQFPLMHFDYNLLSVFRPQQDIDLVIDGTPNDAAKFKEALIQKNLHLQSSHRLWDIRLLRGRYEDRYGLLDDFDFQNQHTDSHSTGLIELTTPPEKQSVIKDAKFWDMALAPFLTDVTENKIHFYYSARHKETSRATQGLNPEIISVIRFLTKMFQFKLSAYDSDWPKIKETIEQFLPETITEDSYAWKWLKKNVPHMLLYSIDLEYTFDTLNSLNLPPKIKKLEALKSAESLSYIIGREPLRSAPLGTAGPTAAQLGINLVSHVTRSPQAVESINRSPRLEANVLISRTETPFEGAAYGTGFYTRRADGDKTFSGQWVTLFEVNPNARQGIDFILVGGREENIVLFKNKAALTVVPSPRTTIGSIIDAIESQDIINWDASTQRRAALSLDRQLPLLNEEERAEYQKKLKQSINPEEANLFKVLQSMKPILESKHFRSDVADIFADYILSGEQREIGDLVFKRLQWLITNQLDQVHEDLRTRLRKKIDLKSASIEKIIDLKARQLQRLIGNHIYDLAAQLAKNLDEKPDSEAENFIQETIEFYERELSRFFSESTVLDNTRLEILHLSSKYRHGVDIVFQHIIKNRPSSAIVNYVKQLFPPNYVPSTETFRLLIAYSTLASLNDYFSYLKASGKQAAVVLRLLLERANREIVHYENSKFLPDGREKLPTIKGVLSLSLNEIGRGDSSVFNSLIEDLIKSGSPEVFLALFDELYRFIESINKNAKYLQIFFDHLPNDETTRRIFAQKLSTSVMNYDLRNFSITDPIFDKLLELQRPSKNGHNIIDARMSSPSGRLTLITNLVLEYSKSGRSSFLRKNFLPPRFEARDRFLAFIQNPQSPSALKKKVLRLLRAFDSRESLETSWARFQSLYEYSELSHPDFDWIRDINGIEDIEVRTRYFQETLGLICPTLLAELK